MVVSGCSAGAIDSMLTKRHVVPVSGSDAAAEPQPTPTRVTTTAATAPGATRIAANLLQCRGALSGLDADSVILTG